MTKDTDFDAGRLGEPAASLYRALDALVDDLLTNDGLDAYAIARHAGLAILTAARAARPEAGWREEDKWLVWSNEHRAWWRGNSRGYTTYLKAAGRYTRAEALDICFKARNGWREGEPPSEIPVLARDAEFCLPAPPQPDEAGG